MLMDLVFSLDSVITAVGMADALGHGGGGVDFSGHHARAGGRNIDICVQEPHREDGWPSYFCF